MISVAAPSVAQLTGAIGATINGLDIRSATDDDIDEVRRAVLRHRVVFLPHQDLDDGELVRLARRFGTLTRSPLDVLLDRAATTSVIEDTAERPPARFAWHTDLSWTPTPPALGFLCAVDVPAYGGDTIWVNQVAAFESLTPSAQDRCRQLAAEHRCDPSLLASIERHHGAVVASELRRGQRPARHPLVRTHDDTGEDGLFLSPLYLHHLIGIDRQRGATLLRRLEETLDDPHHQVRWRWIRGDLAIWDETTTCHRALGDHFPHGRTMRRCVVNGTTPGKAA